MLTDVGDTSRHDCRDLIQLFDQTFRESHATRLCGGAEEPLYAPGRPHRIWFTRNYFASALHEVAHWCVAGRERRLQEDYGYWYAPDGRTAAQQAEFERVEVRPQALEWLFSRAADWRFRPSADNLDAGFGPSEEFKRAIHQQALRFCREGVTDRVHAFLAALVGFYGTANNVEALLVEARFDWRELA
ncbi:elongation factor P hydroxylase [Marinimicrobium sp. C6131]|uniref:elongation factor P hydroxylase n=1 Tax=Marinimicrobium sp. C6131 TaxID=3022676 RepID=UPI00223C9944|nr:elongation factor P hydroxylase [Marinimicrobium sp. C6131]UZJ45906.1 elongation factor P hydroxylase [Marinimicrobium sp. C6131]